MNVLKLLGRGRTCKFPTSHLNSATSMNNNENKKKIVNFQGIH